MLEFPRITTLDEAKAWLTAVFEFLGEAAFHPDNDPRDLCTKDCSSIFSLPECQQYDACMDACLILFNVSNEDLYVWCLKELFKA